MVPTLCFTQLYSFVAGMGIQRGSRADGKEAQEGGAQKSSSHGVHLTRFQRDWFGGDAYEDDHLGSLRHAPFYSCWPGGAWESLVKGDQLAGITCASIGQIPTLLLASSKQEYAASVIKWHVTVASYAHKHEE